jgi:hypothetical protein
MSEVERSGGTEQATPWRPPLSLILVSVAAGAAALIHVAFPTLKIDAVTLGLLAVAALPWLAPVVKSFRFGSLEINLKDLQQNLHEVKSRVEESAKKVDDLSDQVQKIVFSGAVDSGSKSELEKAMTGFFAHLRDAGMPLPSTEPHVEIVDRGRSTPMTYSARTGKILIARKLVADLGRVLWSYGDYLCSSLVQLPSDQWSPQLRAVKSGLAVYLSCSYRGTPEVAKESYDVYQREAAGDDRRRYLETLERQANLESNRFRIRKLSAEPGKAGSSAGDSQLRDTFAWGGTMWRVRAFLGAETTDRLLIEAWRGVAEEPDLAGSSSFGRNLVELTEQQIGPTAAKQVQEIFRKRGLVLATAPAYAAKERLRD